MACDNAAIGRIEVFAGGSLIGSHTISAPLLPIRHTTRTETPTGATLYAVSAAGRTAYGQNWGSTEIHRAWYATGTQFGFNYSYYQGLPYWQLNYLSPGSSTWAGLNPSGNGSAYITAVSYIAGTNPAPTNFLDAFSVSGLLKSYNSDLTLTATYTCRCKNGDCVRGNFPDVCCISCATISGGLNQILAALKTKHRG